jgi:hypothetical protein
MADDMKMTSFKANMGASVAASVHDGLIAQPRLLGAGVPSAGSISPATVTAVVSSVLDEVVTLFGPTIAADVTKYSPQIRTVLSEATIEYLVKVITSIENVLPPPQPNPVIPGGPVAQPRTS